MKLFVHFCPLLFLQLPGTELGTALPSLLSSKEYMSLYGIFGVVKNSFSFPFSFLRGVKHLLNLSRKTCGCKLTRPP